MQLKCTINYEELRIFTSLPIYGGEDRHIWVSVKKIHMQLKCMSINYEEIRFSISLQLSYAIEMHDKLWRNMILYWTYLTISEIKPYAIENTWNKLWRSKIFYSSWKHLSGGTDQAGWLCFQMLLELYHYPSYQETLDWVSAPIKLVIAHTLAWSDLGSLIKWTWWVYSRYL